MWRGGGGGHFLRGMPKAVCMKVTLCGCSSFTIPSPFLLCLQFFTTVILSLYYYRYSAVNTLNTSITLSRQLPQKTKPPHDVFDFVCDPVFYFIFLFIFKQSALGNGSPAVIIFVSYE